MDTELTRGQQTAICNCPEIYLTEEGKEAKKKIKEDRRQACLERKRLRENINRKKNKISNKLEDV